MGVASFSCGNEGFAAILPGICMASAGGIVRAFPLPVPLTGLALGDGGIARPNLGMLGPGLERAPRGAGRSSGAGVVMRGTGVDVRGGGVDRRGAVEDMRGVGDDSLGRLVLDSSALGFTASV